MIIGTKSQALEKAVEVAIACGQGGTAGTLASGIIEQVYNKLFELMKDAKPEEK